MKANTADSEETGEICGVVTRIVFRSDETGYTVCTVRPVSQKTTSRPKNLTPGLGGPGGRKRDADKEDVTVVGNCGTIWVGENLTAKGKWSHHKRHGRQFQAERITCIAPASAEGIRLYLGGGMIKGIGPVMADRLVNAFGEDTLRIIEKESKRLLEVPGVGRKTRAKIKKSWDAQKGIRDIMIFLRGHGVGTAQAMKIYRQYGNDSVAVVTENPYRLCRDVWGIGFMSADKIAMNLGMPAESDLRARAGILHTLHTMAEEGHCFCPWDVLLEEGQSLLGISTEILDRGIKHEAAQRTLIEERGNVYPAALYHAETACARRIRELLNATPAFRPIDADKAVSWAQQQGGINFDPAQVDALKAALTSKVAIITGGPGVGKTTIVSALVDVFRARKLTVSLAAPTGRAAKRMAEATGSEAKTLHRLLKFQPATGGFEYGPGNPLPGEVFIIDEVSMMDISLMALFLGALDRQSHVVLVGDSDQLPSVGPGNVLKDLIASGQVPCRRLDTIFRQQDRSLIVLNAHRVNRGEPLELHHDTALSDFYFVPETDPDKVISHTINLVAKRIPRRFGFDPRTSIQVLTPMRRNRLGADNLNTVLQQTLNPTGASIQRFGRTYRVSDRVMQIRNNYDKDIFNGDIGIITTIDSEQQTVTVDFYGRNIEYDKSGLDELVLAYACSIHKSQGSEYPAVVILMATQHFKLLQRNLLYTALTRGKELVCLVGSRKAVLMAIRNNKTLLRRTSLARRICAETGAVIVEPDTDYREPE